jgi:drug/metabolite transporter (DMT)-like permease
LATHSNNLKAYLALFGGLSFMCFAAILVKSAHAPGIVTAFYRMAIGTAVLIIPFLISFKTNKTRMPVLGIVFAAAAGVCFAGDMAFWATAVVLSNATIPTLTANLAPLWVGFGTVFIFREKLKPGFWLGLVISIAGMILLIHRDLKGNSHITAGALMGMAAGVFYGIFYLVSQQGRKLINTLRFLFIFTISSAIILTVLMFAFGYKFTGYDHFTWWMFVAIGIGVQVCGWFLINFSQGYLPASTVAPTLLGQPVLTFFLAALLLKEHLSAWHIVGGSIVVIGIYLVHYSRNKY